MATRKQWRLAEQRAKRILLQSGALSAVESRPRVESALVGTTFDHGKPVCIVLIIKVRRYTKGIPKYEIYPLRHFNPRQKGVK